MSFISKSIDQRINPNSGLPGNVLIRWNHEPLALYQMKKQGAFYFIWPFLPFLVFSVLYVFTLFLRIKTAFPLWILPIIAFIAGIAITSFRLLPSNQWIELTEDGISQRLSMPGGGGYFFSWMYGDIDYCNFERVSYLGIKYCVLKFVIKTQPEHKIIIIPQNVCVDSVLKILRDKCVRLNEDERS